MRKLLIITLISALTIGNMVGCSSNSESKQENTKNNTTQEVDKETDKFKKEEAKYGALLTSGKTYEEMDVAERTDFTEVTQTFDSFTEEFKEKYKDIINKIELTKQEAVAKWEAEKEAQKKQEETTTTEELERENIIGTSNKNFKDIETLKPSSVRNDVTGKWRVSKIATNENILEYAKSYYNNNFSNGDEIHAIVNFTLNTTTQISKLFDGIIVVTIHEYVNGEEHDAKKMFGGDVLGEYWIYLDNGDIEEIKE